MMYVKKLRLKEHMQDKHRAIEQYIRIYQHQRDMLTLEYLP